MSITKGSVIRFGYEGGHGGNRTVYVYGEEPDGDIMGFDFDRENVRRFKPSKMRGLTRVPAEVKVLDKTALPSGVLSTVLRGYRADGFRVIENDRGVVAVKVSPPTLRVGAGAGFFMVNDTLVVRLTLGRVEVRDRTISDQYRTVDAYGLRDAINKALGE